MITFTNGLRVMCSMPTIKIGKRQTAHYSVSPITRSFWKVSLVSTLPYSLPGVRGFEHE
nr:MAG TPA_asm: hypothetical protein [Caudoviricetes sp.]